MKHMFAYGIITKTDRRFLAILFLAAALFFLLSALTGRPGKWVVIRIDGIETGRYPLEEDRELLLTCEAGENLLRIQDGQADIIEADCPDGLCMRHSPISRTGESIVCLPHRLVASIDGASAREEWDMDALTQ